MPSLHATLFEFGHRERGLKNLTTATADFHAFLEERGMAFFPSLREVKGAGEGGSRAISSQWRSQPL